MKKLFRIFLTPLCVALCLFLPDAPASANAQKEVNKAEIYSLFCDLSPYEVSLLERAVEATVPEGSFALRVSLAATVLNRLASPRFPDSLPKLIRGSSFLSQDTVEPSDKTRQAVLSALLGVSPVCRSTYARHLEEGEELPREAVSYVVIGDWVFWEE